MIADLRRRIAHSDSHHRLIVGLVGSAIVGFIVSPLVSLPVCLTTIWVVFALIVLTLAWTTILMAHPCDLPRLSRLEDSSRTLILVFVIVAAIASLVAVVALLDAMGDQDRVEHITLAAVAVASAWALVHTLFALRYAHLYYGNSLKQTQQPRGLNFPNDSEPDYLDFAYFSFVIGMTSQVSDVSIESKTMRRTALAHGVLSFLFNTIIIALTISGLSGAL